MQTTARTNNLEIGRAVAIAIALTVILSVGASWGESIRIVLKNGASVEGELLKRSVDKIVIDLGFQVVVIPADAIDSQAKETQTTTEPAVAAANNNNKNIPPPTPEKQRRRAGPFNEIVKELEEAVVVVSNPYGFGAGFIIDPSGLLLTNHHVIRGEKHNDVTFFMRKPNGETEKKIFRKVEVKGFSSLLDCALLKIPDDELKDIELPTLDLAPAGSLQSGLKVYAIGNPGLGAQMLRHSVSQGILSSADRNFNDILYLQTTAAVNPGNSGGPLLNEQGEVAGLVTFKASFQEGLAFALPVWYLRHFVSHVDAFAPGPDDKNTGYRYHDPSEWRAKNIDSTTENEKENKK